MSGGPIGIGALHIASMMERDGVEREVGMSATHHPSQTICEYRKSCNLWAGVTVGDEAVDSKCDESVADGHARKDFESTNGYIITDVLLLT